MEVKWFVFSVYLALGVSCVAGNVCNVNSTAQCYTNLLHYERDGFPFYGQDELELADTCRMMNESFECLSNYVSTCNGHEDCKEDCLELLKDIGVFLLNPGLRELQAELCSPNSALRETYLENYVCLEDNAQSYISCHNDSEDSEEFMTTITDPHEAVEARCCFFSWYHDCFVNVTKDTCGVNATFFVSFSMHKLISHIADLICKDSHIACDRPPLPHEGDLDTDMPDVVDNDIDNDIEGRPKGSSTSIAASVFVISSTIMYAWLVRNLFK